MAIFLILGTILSLGFMVCSYLPVRIAFPVLAATLCGPIVKIPDAILLDSFTDYLATYESLLLRDSIAQSKQKLPFSSQAQAQLINILSRLDCTEIPSPSNIKRLAISVANHLFLGKLLGALDLFALNSGVPILYNSFWKHFSIGQLFDL